MLSSLLIPIGIIFLLILLSGFFSGSETALTATSRARMHRLAEEGERRAYWVTCLLEQKERLLSAILLGNNLVNIFASVLASSLFLQIFGEGGIVYTTLIMTLLVVIFAEILPKTYAISTPDITALRVAGILRVFVWLLSPITLGLQIMARFIMRQLGFDSERAGHIIPPHEEIRSVIGLHHSEETVGKGDRDMLEGILDLQALTVGDIMMHRKNMQMVDIGLPIAEIIRQVLQSPYTRIPFWREEPENIIGVLHTKDLLHALAVSLPEDNNINIGVDIEPLLRKPWFVLETTGLTEQLTAFRTRKAHFAVVVDEYGALMGLITLEDILEEIVGKIDDEHDRPKREVIPGPDGCLVVSGDAALRDLNREMGWSLPDEEANTLAGLIIHEARTIPRPGQIFVFHGLRFRIIERTRNQIQKIEISNQPSS